MSRLLECILHSAHARLLQRGRPLGLSCKVYFDPQSIQLVARYGFISGNVVRQMLTIRFLYVKPDLRGFGFGSRLLYDFGLLAQTLGAKHVFLEDASSRHGQTHNIYARLGLRLVDPDSCYLSGAIHVMLRRARAYLRTKRAQWLSPKRRTRKRCE